MDSSNNNSSWKIPTFCGEDYEYWYIKIKILLIGKGFWEIVEDGYEEPSDWNALQGAGKTSKKEAQKKISCTLYHLQMALDKSIFPRISSCTSSKDAWKDLKDGYQGRNQVKQVRIQTLKRDFKNLKMKDDEKVVDYCVRVQSCVNKMKTLGEIIENKVVVKKVLRSLLPKWNLVAIIIEERKNLATLTNDKLLGSLMSHEERLQDPSSSSIEVVMIRLLHSKKKKPM